MRAKRKCVYGWGGEHSTSELLPGVNRLWRVQLDTVGEELLVKRNLHVNPVYQASKKGKSWTAGPVKPGKIISLEPGHRGHKIRVRDI